MKLLTDHTCYMTYVITFCEVFSSKDMMFIKCHTSACVRTHTHGVFYCAYSKAYDKIE